MYYGETTRSGRFGSIVLQESRFRGAEVLPWHEHTRPFVTLVMAGGYEEENRRGSRRCRPSSAVVHPTGEWHRNRIDRSSAKLINVEWSAGWNGGILETGPLLVEHGAFAALGARLLGELAWPDEHSTLVVECVVSEIAVEIRRGGFRERARPRWLVLAEEMIREGFRESLSLDDIASRTGVHPAHLAREFRRHFGLSIGEFRRRIRLERAKALLDGETPIAEIALEAGFTDQSHLTRLFRRAYGTTPAQYRRSGAVI